MPKVSIIIPYNKDRGFLQEAIESAQSQTFKDIEIIKQFGQFGQSKNINDVLKISNGEWIKILHEDDLLPPDSIQLLYDKAMEGYDWVAADAVNFGNLTGGWLNAGYWHAVMPTLKSMLIVNQIHGGTTFYKKQVLLDVGGYDESLWTGEEYELNLRLLALGYKLGIVNKVVYKYRLHDHNKSMDMSVEDKEKRRKYIICEIKTRYYKYIL
jgi:glycosyltransferase involved in cell wall biosynthesis